MDIQVCFSADGNYIQPLTVAITSVLYHNDKKDTMHIYVLDGGISDKDKQMLNVLVKQYDAEINFLAVPTELFENAPIQTSSQAVSHLTPAAYYRILLSTLLPHINTIIYLDCDLVCRASLSELCVQDMGEDWIRGIIDIDYERHCKRLQLNQYVCSGVLLINLKGWRENQVERQCMEYMKNHTEQILYHDQDVLNVVCQEHCSYIDKTWNVQACKTKLGRESGFNELGDSGKIIHFIGGRKPWHAGCNHPFKQEYFKYLAMTPFKNFVWEHRLLCLKYFFFHIKRSHGTKKWYLCGIRVRKENLQEGIFL